MQSLLPKLGEWRPTSSGRTTFNHQDAATGWSVTLTVDKADALSCQLWDLTHLAMERPSGGLRAAAWTTSSDIATSWSP